MNENSDNLDRIGRAMQAAWSRVKKAQTRMWGEWMTIGEGLLEGRHWAMRQAGTNKPEGKGYVIAYAEWLKRYRVDDMDKSDRAKLLQLMEERPAVEEWRALLTEYERRNLNNPVVIWRKWTAATRVKKPKSRTAGVSATEHGRARATVEQLQARVTELEEELEAARESGAKPPKPDAKNELACAFCGMPDYETKVAFKSEKDSSIFICARCITLASVQVEEVYDKLKAKMDKEAVALGEPAAKPKAKAKPKRRGKKSDPAVLSEMEDHLNEAILGRRE